MIRKGSEKMSQHHEHHHTHTANKKTLLISFIIITAYMIIEAIGGYVTNSLALLSDAGHMFSDSLSLGIALVAFMLSERAASYHKTYGNKRFEILATIVNGIALIGIALFIFYEAVERFFQPPEVESLGMLVISIIGLLVNVLVAWIMMRGGDTKDNLNMRGAFLHVISDMLGSVGAIVAALLMLAFGWVWADTVASVLVAALVLRSGWIVTKEALYILMEATPKNVDIHAVIQAIEDEEVVESIHDLHVWTITSGLNALSCHIVVHENMTIEESSALLHRIEHKLEHLHISHVTVQVESDQHPHKDSVLCTLEHTVTHMHMHQH